MVPKVDVVIVVGSPNSSNSNRLREVAANRGVPAYMVDHADELRPEWVAGKQRVGVTAGASAPEVLVHAGHRAPEGAGRARRDRVVGHRRERDVSAAQGTRRQRNAKAPEVGPPRSETRHGASALRAEPREQRNERRRGDRRRHRGDDRMPAGFAQRARQRFGEVERQQQRQPLPRPAFAARDARKQERERQRLQREPRAAAGSGASTSLPEQFEQGQRGQPAMVSAPRATSAHEPASVIRRR